MARVSTFLNFPRNAEQAFVFYRSVFGGEFSDGIYRFAEMPVGPGQPPVAEADRNLVLHVALPILGGHVLMGMDAPESMGYAVKPGNNCYINLEPDSRAETERLFNALAANGSIETPLQDMYWGAWFGSLVDQFGVRWMFNCTSKS